MNKLGSRGRRALGFCMLPCAMTGGLCLLHGHLYVNVAWDAVMLLVGVYGMSELIKTDGELR